MMEKNWEIGEKGRERNRKRREREENEGRGKEPNMGAEKQTMAINDHLILKKIGNKKIKLPKV